MTKEKQRILEIALSQSLPYGLKLWDRDSEEGSETIRLTGICITDGETTVSDEHGNFDIPLKDVKPLLFPLSSLVKEITVGGKTFIPIVELSKYFENVGKCTLDSESGQLDSTTTYGWSECHGDDYSGYSIAWNRNKNGFFVYYSEDVETIEETDNAMYRVEYGYEVVDLMTSWHIDYRGLIEQSLAISVHDLPENPYE
jgi:hypothetical protein